MHFSSESFLFMKYTGEVYGEGPSLILPNSNSLARNFSNNPLSSHVSG